MSNVETILSILIVLLFVGLIWTITELSSLKKKKAEPQNNTSHSPDAVKLQLQAYERITILSERISLKSLLSRIPSGGLSAKQMQQNLIQNIKQEFDYNISQQIYVRPEIWEAVDNMKEQNIYVINQLATALPAHATGMDLNKKVLDFLLSNQKVSIQHAVNEAINFEVKKLM